MCRRASICKGIYKNSIFSIGGLTTNLIKHIAQVYKCSTKVLCLHLHSLPLARLHVYMCTCNFSYSAVQYPSVASQARKAYCSLLQHVIEWGKECFHLLQTTTSTCTEEHRWSANHLSWTTVVLMWAFGMQKSLCTPRIIILDGGGGGGGDCAFSKGETPHEEYKQSHQ